MTQDDDRMFIFEGELSISIISVLPSNFSIGLIILLLTILENEKAVCTAQDYRHLLTMRQ